MSNSCASSASFLLAFANNSLQWASSLTGGFSPAAAGLAAVAVLLAYEHSLVKPRDLSRVNAAFFTINGYISLLFFVTWAADILMHH